MHLRIESKDALNQLSAQRQEVRSELNKNEWALNELARSEEILASSKGWVASFLNFLPGLGSGYLYQRRWKPYFFTIIASTAWFALGFFLQGDSEPSQSEQIIGISGLFFISIVTVTEANLAFKKASNKTKAEKEKIISSNKKGWFK